jgi:polyhydroxybutyrate depolymerase
VPIISFQGTADPVNPYLGGGQPYWQYGVPVAQKRWAELNDCHQGPRTQHVTEHVSLIADFACEGNAKVLLYLVEGGGHTWPGSPAFLSLPALGPVTFEIDATELAWDFFEKHRLPGRGYRQGNRGE